MKTTSRGIEEMSSGFESTTSSEGNFMISLKSLKRLFINLIKLTILLKELTILDNIIIQIYHHNMFVLLGVSSSTDSYEEFMYIGDIIIESDEEYDEGY